MGLFTRGNHKLCTDIGIWSIMEGPPEDGGSCTNMTSICYEACYARKPTTMYTNKETGINNVVLHRKANLELSRRDDFPEIILKHLSRMRRPFQMIRIHEAGDFYSQEYLDKWIHISRAWKKPILTYTRCHHLDFSQKPANLAIYASMDADMSSEHLKKFKRTAWISFGTATQPSELGMPEATFICSKKTHHGLKQYCGDTCKVCWHEVANVVFPAH
jgi:hypothetical protein